MLQKYNMWKVLGVFFDNPNPKGGGLQLREISRKAGISPMSVKIYLSRLTASDKWGYPLVLKSKHRIYGYPVYWANRASELFLFYKRINTVISLEESRILDYLGNTCMPTSIILFGSAARGEDLKESDIDMFVQSKERKLNLEKFEKYMGRKINILFEENFNKLSSELKNNIINGVILKGYLKVF